MQTIKNTVVALLKRTSNSKQPSKCSSKLSYDTLSCDILPLRLEDREKVMVDTLENRHQYCFSPFKSQLACTKVKVGAEFERSTVSLMKRSEIKLIENRLLQTALRTVNCLTAKLRDRPTTFCHVGIKEEIKIFQPEGLCLIGAHCS